LLLQRFGTSLLCCSTLLGLTELVLSRLQPPLQLLDMPPGLFDLGRHRLTLFPGAVDLAVRTILHAADVALLHHAFLLGLEPQRLQIQL
jgi:hypothetical protein